MRARIASAVALGIALLFACAGPKYEDDDDSGGNGGNSGETATGGSSGATSGSSGKGTQTGGAGGKGGASSGGASGTSNATGGDGNATSTGGTGTSGGTGGDSGTTGGTSGATGASGGSGGGAGTSASGGVGGASGGTGGTTAGTGGDTSGTGGDGGSGGGITIPVCNLTCQTAADCANDSSIAYDEDNYACTDGLCVYLGCNSDEECSAMTTGMTCADSGTGFSTCAIACVTAEDCSQSIPSFDTDNMACLDGGCFYLGCNTDEECQATYEGYVCRESRLGVRSCTEPCATAADCALGAATYEEQNYACEDSACIWIGCTSDTECQRVSPPYVCR